MKKKITKMLALFLVVGVLGSVLAVSAAAGFIHVQYTGMSEMYVSIDISSSGRADCSAYVLSRSGYTAKLTMELQRSKDDSSWSTIKTWTASGSGSKILDKGYYVKSGYDYRTKLTVKVYNSNDTLVDSATTYSGVSSY